MNVNRDSWGLVEVYEDWWRYMEVGEIVKFGWICWKFVCIVGENGKRVFFLVKEGGEERYFMMFSDCFIYVVLKERGLIMIFNFLVSKVFKFMEIVLMYVRCIVI